MPLISLGQMVLLCTVLLQLTAALAPWDRNEEDLQGLLRSDTRQLDTPSLFGRNYADALMEARLSRIRGAGLERRRQLGDIEFSNRYAEFLRSRAKHSSMCAFLRRMQSVRKSGVEADMEKVNVLLKQYMCPAVLSWPSDL